MKELSVGDLLRPVDSKATIEAEAQRLRTALSLGDVSLGQILSVLQKWGDELGCAKVEDIPGVSFLRLWFREGTLRPMIGRELGPSALVGEWMPDGRARIKVYPVGIVGHWPAGNIDTQPILSMTCALLGRNAALVRVPAGIVEPVSRMIESLLKVQDHAVITDRIFLATFDHSRDDLQEAMARAVDGAIIWGSEQAALKVRSLPFPHWARIAVFGPRISIAVMDASAWTSASESESWCRRLARDVWQFDQHACSSPQVLFVERKPGASAFGFCRVVRSAFESENRLHPRYTIAPSLTSAICKARADWLLKNSNNRAIFPQGPEWTILLGSGSDIPVPTEGRTLIILEVDDLREPIEKLNGNVQTMGVAIGDSEREALLASLAAEKGVDRVVKLGRMHTFGSPWDGRDLVRSMVRQVRYLESTE